VTRAPSLVSLSGAGLTAHAWSLFPNDREAITMDGRCRGSEPFVFAKREGAERKASSETAETHQTTDMAKAKTATKTAVKKEQPDSD